MAKRRKRHTEEFKREAVLALESRGDRSIEDVAKGLGLSASQLLAGVAPAKPDTSSRLLLILHG